MLARHDAIGGAPPGIDPAAFATACLADTYVAQSGLTEVESGIAGPATISDLLWPEYYLWPVDITVPNLAAAVSGEIDELVVVPADTPDLPAMVLAKVFKALQRADIVIAPEHAGAGMRSARPGSADGGLDSGERPGPGRGIGHPASGCRSAAQPPGSGACVAPDPDTHLGPSTRPRP